jgi:hypothetical protein
MLYDPRILLAFARIFAALDADSFPRFTICVARAFAFAACARSGIGYFLDPGRPKVLEGNDFRSIVSISPIGLVYHTHPSTPMPASVCTNPGKTGAVSRTTRTFANRNIMSAIRLADIKSSPFFTICPSFR